MEGFIVLDVPCPAVSPTVPSLVCPCPALSPAWCLLAPLLGHPTSYEQMLRMWWEGDINPPLGVLCCVSTGAEVCFYLPRHPRAAAGTVLLSHSGSSPGTHHLLPCSSCSCSICANYFSAFSHLLFAKMAELFHPVLFPGVFSGFARVPAGLPWTASPADHLPLPGYLLSHPRSGGLRHHPGACWPPARGCFCVYRSAIARVAQQRGSFPLGFVVSLE